MGDFLESVALFQQGARDLSAGFKDYGARKRADRAEADAKKAREDLSAKFSDTSIGQTELGQVASLGIANNTLKADPLIQKWVTMPSEEMFNKMMTDPNTLKNPELMETLKKGFSIYGQNQQANEFFKSKGREMGKWFGPEGMNAKTNAARAANEAGGKITAGFSVDTSPISQAFKKNYENGIMKLKTNTLPGFENSPAGEVALDINKPWVQISADLMNKKSGGFLGFGGDRAYTDTQIDSIHAAYVTKLAKDAENAVGVANPVLLNDMAAPNRESVAGAIAGRIYGAGLDNGLYQSDTDGKTKSPVKINTGRMYESVFLSPLNITGEDPRILAASPEVKAMWALDHGLATKEELPLIIKDGQLDFLVIKGYQRLQQSGSGVSADVGASPSKKGESNNKKISDIEAKISDIKSGKSNLTKFAQKAELKRLTDKLNDYKKMEE